jgi:hypothetical protein
MLIDSQFKVPNPPVLQFPRYFHSVVSAINYLMLWWALAYLGYQECIASGSHGLPKVLVQPAPLFQGWPPGERAACSRLLSPWIPHAVRLCWGMLRNKLPFTFVWAENNAIFQKLNTLLLILFD